MPNHFRTPPRLPLAEDPDDPIQLRAALLDRDRRIARLRSELVALERWSVQLASSIAELTEMVDDTRATIEHAYSSLPDLLESEIADLEVAVASDKAISSDHQ